MVVRLSDLRSGKTSEDTKSKVVRLSDIRKTEINPNGGVGESTYGPTSINPIQPSKQTPPPNKESLADKLQKPNIIDKIMNTINPFKDVGEYAAPNAPMIGDHGEIPGTNARQQFLKDNPVQSTGSPILDKAYNFVGNAGSMFVPMGTGGALINDLAKGTESVLASKLGQSAVNGAGNAASKAASAVNPLLNKVGMGLSEDVANKAGQGLVKGGSLGAAYGASQPFITGDNQLSDVPKSALENVAMFGGGDALLPFAHAGLSELGNKIAGTKLGDAFRNFFAKNVPQEAPQKILALPPASEESLAAYAKKNRPSVNVLPTNETPIYGKGDIKTFALPESNTPRIISDIQQQAKDLIKPPTSRRDLIDYVGQHLQIDRPEVVKLDNKDLYEVGQMIRSNTNMDTLHAKIAAEQGYNWNDLISGKSVTGHVDAPVNRLQFARKAATTEPVIGADKTTDTIPVTDTPKLVRLADVRKNVEPDAKVKGQELKDLKTGDETKFAQTVQSSEHTTPELKLNLMEKPVIGARTTDVLNRQQANDLITKHGREGLYSKLMAKTKQFSASETTAAQILAKHFSSLGGDENLSKAIDLVSKTAKGGREMGQAIQSLSQWNKLDQAGALLLGERQLNKGIEDTKDFRKLTVAQAAPIKEAAQKAEEAAQTKSLADEVLNIVANKKEGESLTEAEKATIKQFNEQVKTINEKTKPFLPKEKVVSKPDATIKEVSQIEPKARTRDQVVSFLDAKAAKARQRLAEARNKISSTPFDTYADMAIIGASHIAKGIVKLSDFTEQMVKDFGTGIKPQVNDIFTKATNIFRKENGLPTVQELDKVVNKAVKDERFTAEDAANFKAWAAEIGHYADQNLKAEATQDLQAAMKDLGDSTLGQKIATVQTGSMLLNAVTMERNVLGNAAQLIGDKVSKVVTVPIDWAASKLTGEQRTIMFSSMNQEKFWKNFMIGTKSGWRGVSPNGMLDSYGIHPNVFGKKNPLKYITKALGASMQGFDHAFYSTAKGDVLATYAEQLGKARGLSKEEIKAGMKDLIVQLDDRIHELADHAGLYATYQDETLLSKGAEMLRKGLNEASTGVVSRALVERGMSKKFSMEGFGAGDVLVKFAKTPANLVMRGLDYSPVGFIRSIMDLGTFALKREKFNQHEAVRSLGRAITGTLGFTGMGYILADAGILTGSSSMDKDVRSIQEQSGQGAYKVNWSALGRFMRSGFDYDAAAYQPGDRLMDFQWIQPAAISIAMGVNANRAVKAHEAGDQTSGWQMAGKALLGGLQTVLENPMVQGLSSVIDAGTDIIKKQDPTKLINIAKGVPASFVPTLSNQARQSTDNYQRETFDKSLITEIGNMMANKVPGLSKNLPISYDSLGNAREKVQGGQANTVAQYLTSFFSPAKMTQYQVSPEAKMVLDLMNQSGDATLLPRIANKYFHVSQGKQLKDLKVDLTKEQFSQLQQETGKMVSDKLSQQATYLANPNVSLQKKVDKVKGILTDVGKKARQDIGQQMGFQKSKVKS